MSKSQYVDRREAARSYRPTSGSMSPGLLRAREPYRVKNAVLGLALGAFAAGVWAYSISAVKQDVFDDVDAEVEALGATGTGAGLGANNLAAGVAEKKKGVDAKAPATTTVEAPANTPAVVKGDASVVSKAVKTFAGSPKGVLPHLLGHRLPWLLHPEKKTLVWGAPPVDNIGKLGGRSSF